MVWVISIETTDLVEAEINLVSEILVVRNSAVVNSVVVLRNLRCTMRSVVSVAALAKCHLDQPETEKCSVVIASKTREGIGRRDLSAIIFPSRVLIVGQALIRNRLEQIWVS